MVWLNEQRVTWNMSQSHLYNDGNKILILSQSSEEGPPHPNPIRFAPVNVIDPKPGRPACVSTNHGLYVSRHKQIIYYLQHSDSTLHGPCVRSGLAWKEYDTANYNISVSVCLLIDRQMSKMARCYGCWWHSQKWMSFFSNMTPIRTMMSSFSRKRMEGGGGTLNTNANTWNEDRRL